MRKALLLLHLSAALLSGAFLIILGVTGAIMAFEEELDHLLNAHLFTVKPEGTALSISAVQEALAKAYPDTHFGGLKIPTRSDEPFVVQKKSQQIFINGYTGRVIGTRETPTIFGRIHQFHTSLLIGLTGHILVGVAAGMLILLVVSGIVLWWPAKIAHIPTTAPARVIILHAHHMLGIGSAVFVLILGMTGLSISLSDIWIPWANAKAGTQPPIRDLPSRATDHSTTISADQAVQNAGAALIGATAFYVSTPSSATGCYHIAMRFPEDLTPGGRSWVNIDRYDGSVLSVTSSRTPATITGLVTLNRAIHTGDIMGLPSKAIASLSSLVLVIQTLTGVYLWWARIRAKRTRPAAPSPTA